MSKSVDAFVVFLTVSSASTGRQVSGAGSLDT